MSRFAGLNANVAKAEPKVRTRAAAEDRPQAAEPLPESAAPAVDPVERPKPGRAKAREGKKPVIGYFSEDLSRELRMLSITENTTMQALLGEGIDLLLRNRGKHPFGER